MCGVLIQGTPFLVEQIFTDKYWLDTKTDRQMSTVKWLLYDVRFTAITKPPNDHMVNGSFGNLVVDTSTLHIVQQPSDS